ncbi:NlpC/P60 family protein [Allorhizobium undicola]|uniref:NlpC/P60 family protein n=1 Tax=Allorhizobium undicola TaxID=78527 RepID=UPI00048916D5|nr:NlpC/P60 family protein [Allorhizobium undicola]
MQTGQRVLRLAEGWIGTPYRHQASEKGVGADCLGLVRGLWRELYGCEPEAVPAYGPDWAERSGEERLLDAAGRHFLPVPGFGSVEPGDVLVFRFRAHHAAKHLGIWAGDGVFIHAYEQAAVTRSALVPSWKRRIAGIFRFPEVE